MLELTSFPSGASQAPQALDQRLGMPPRQARRYPDDKHSYGPIANTKKSYAKRAACQVEALEVAGESSENAGIGPILTLPKVPA